MVAPLCEVPERLRPAPTSGLDRGGEFFAGLRFGRERCRLDPTGSARSGIATTNLRLGNAFKAAMRYIRDARTHELRFQGHREFAPVLPSNVRSSKRWWQDGAATKKSVRARGARMSEAFQKADIATG